MNSEDDIFDFFIKHLEAINLDKTRLSYPTRPIVIFCGGERREKHPTVTYERLEAQSFASLRECLISLYNQYMPHYWLYIPEDLNWQNGSVFKDLLEFEVAFSHLSTVIVIITETPGSLVELGIFSSDRSNKDKLLIIADSQFAESKSFINKGVFDYIRNSDDQAVKFFPLDSYKSNIDGTENLTFIDKDIAKEAFNDTTSFVNEKLKRKTCNFDIKNKTHFFSFLVEVIHLYRVVSTKEIYKIVEYLNAHLVEEIFNENDVRQFFMLMRELDFVKFQPHGSERFFHLGDDLKSISRIQFSYKEEKKYDRARNRNEIFEFYKKNSNIDKTSRAKLKVISKVYGNIDSTESFF